MAADGATADARGLARRVLALLAMLCVPAAGIAGWLGDGGAAVSAVIGVGFVALLFGVSGLLLAWVMERSAAHGLAILAGASMLRLVVYAAALSGLARLAWVDRTSLALATGGAVAITLFVELRSLARSPRLFWIDADAERTAAGVPHATRSQPL